jgi:serine protease inhibitor
LKELNLMFLNCLQIKGELLSQRGLQIKMKDVPELKAEAFELPLNSSRQSLIVVMPKKHDDFIWMEMKLADVNFDDLFNFENVPTKMVDKLTLPRIRMESDIRLINPLMSLGLTSLFPVQNPDLIQTSRDYPLAGLSHFRQLVAFDILEEVIVCGSAILLM